MAQFTIRVELHEAQWTDYDTLHAAMARQGFSRLVTADDGRSYQLPWAEYNGTAALTSMQVLGAAQTAANSTGKKNSVLVTESKSRAWSGLAVARS
ncbi:MAG: type V toxin-antitoxin system endoribonuclease antitoxin GhoS [Candidatus Acidiferrales bacterium]